MKSAVCRLSVFGATGLGLLSGCMSSGSDSGNSPAPAAVGTATVSSGTVTGFGSLFVNGVEYKTAAATLYLPDTSPATIRLGTAETDIRSHLKIGMQVKVSGRSDGTAGTAREIEFKDNMEGLVTAATANTLTLLGTTVYCDSATRIYSSANVVTTLLSVIPGKTWVEVSGAPDNAGVFKASYVGLKAAAGSAQELKGYVVAAAATSFDLGLAAGIKAVTVKAPLPAGIAVGSLVEVIFDKTGKFVRVEVEDDLVRVDARTVKKEAEGYVTAIHDNDVILTVNGRQQVLTLSSDTAYYFKSDTMGLIPVTITNLAVGRKVFAEGLLAAGVIVAKRINIEP